MVEIRKLRKGDWFTYNGATYRKGESANEIEYIIYGVSENAYTCAKLYKCDMVEKVRKTRKVSRET